MRISTGSKILLYSAVILAVILVAVVILVSSCSKEEETIEPVTEAETETETETETEALAASDGLFIVIDPGHGFGDIGNEDGFTSEYEYYYTMLYSQEIKEKLEAMGATVMLTHDGETYTSEEELTSKIAEYGITFSSTNVVASSTADNLFNKYERVMYTSILNYEYGVDFFLSVHFNAYDTDAISGTAIYYYSENPGADICQEFAELVMSEVGYASNYSGIYSQTYDDAYVVVKYCDYTAVLIECAFMTNETDAANIESDIWRDEFTTIVANAIVTSLTGEEIED